ncbi:MAG: TldD/PmbA family protein, partial [Asgard group archaeon]|nr:TldD/PmbA family protein [Asgard group archaeon]
MTADPYDLVEKAIDEGNKLGAKYIEARLVRTNNNISILKNGVPELGGFFRTNGIGIRVLKNGGLGFASFNEMTKD